MKTKEFEVWAHPSCFNTEREVRTDVCKYEFVGSVKAKLIIEIPEKSVTITESEWESMKEKARQSHWPNKLGDIDELIKAKFNAQR